MNAAVQVIGWSLSSQGCWRNLSCNIHLRRSFLLVSWCLSYIEFVVCQVSSCGMLRGLHQRMGSEKEREWFAVELR